MENDDIAVEALLEHWEAAWILYFGIFSDCGVCAEKGWKLGWAAWTSCVPGLIVGILFMWTLDRGGMMGGGFSGADVQGDG